MNRRTLMSCLALGGAVPGAFAAAAGTSKTIEVPATKPFLQFISGVVFAQVPDRGYRVKPLAMDIVMPAQKGRYPLILYINGGGFINANKDGYIQHRVELAEHGYVVASMTYRVAPTSVFPAALEDAKAAIRFLRAHAETFSINPEKVGVMGGSAGGYLSAMVGTTTGVKGFDKGDFLDQSSDVSAVVDLYGLSDLTRIGDDYSEEEQATHRSAGATEALWVNGSPVFGAKDGGIFADPEKTKAANPITYISQSTPPFLLLHGDQDTVVSPSQTELLRAALSEHGIEATRYVVRGAKHGGPHWVQPEITRLIIDFFDAKLK